MGERQLGLAEALSLALGGMIGGGIFAVLGVVAKMAGAAAWLAFVAGGVLALCSGAANIALNTAADGRGGPVTYLQAYTGRTTLAGMAGWTITIGYVGTSALYAFAFGSYGVSLLGIHTAYGIPTRPLLSAAVIGGFVGVNALGATASGRTEDVLVGLKVAILVLFAAAGFWFGFVTGQLSFGFGAVGMGPLFAAALSFVAFEGWELLLYDQESLRDPERTVGRAIYGSIVAATVLYAAIAVVTTNLLTAATIARHAETALALAAEPFLGNIGFALIGAAALFSTGSALNATLFSTARFARRLGNDDLIPDQLESEDASGEPVRELVIIGGLAMAFSLLGSLEGITSFASLTFIVIMAAMNFLALTHRDRLPISTVIPAVGLAGTMLATPLLLWHLATRQFEVFLTVGGIATLVVAVEVLYFEREWLVAELEVIES